MPAALMSLLAELPRGQLQFEATLDGGAQVHNDGTYGWAAAPDVRTKWMQVPKVAAYPNFSGHSRIPKLTAESPDEKP